MANQIKEKTDFQVRDELKCPICGSKRIQPQDNFCLDCGLNLKKKLVKA